MPIYEFYCPDNHTIYQFYARTLAQGQTVPPCPANPSFKMEKMVSAFAIGSAGAKDSADGVGPEVGPGGGEAGEDPRMEAAMQAMEQEFSSIDENDPKAMGRMMRRMAELTGEKIDGEMEEVVRKLEEGTDPESLDEQLGGDPADDGAGDPYGMGESPGLDSAKQEAKEARFRYKARRQAPTRDPQLYDY